MTDQKRELTKGNAYFIVLNDDGEVYQAEYRGFHAETQCYWFTPLFFANAKNGTQWVFWRRIRVLHDLGKPLTGQQFDAALEKICE